MAGKKGSDSGTVSVYSRIYNVHTGSARFGWEIDEFLATIHMLNIWTHKIQSTFNGTWTHRTQLFVSFIFFFFSFLSSFSASPYFPSCFVHCIVNNSCGMFIGGKSQVHVIMPSQEYEMAKTYAKSKTLWKWVHEDFIPQTITQLYSN